MGESKMSYMLTLISLRMNCWRVKPRGGTLKLCIICLSYPFVIIIILMDFLTTQVFGHDVERYVCWFVTWGVLCHSTVTKILKRRCKWHTPEGRHEPRRRPLPHREGQSRMRADRGNSTDKWLFSSYTTNWSYREPPGYWSVVVGLRMA